MVFCNTGIKAKTPIAYLVTILILIDGFLQSGGSKMNKQEFISHNPYFNRWFSAIKDCRKARLPFCSHNPYFNRWFSAILNFKSDTLDKDKVTILILIDGFLQLGGYNENKMSKRRSQSLF